MTRAEMSEISILQLDGLVGAPGELDAEMMGELRVMWAGMKADLVKDWPVADGLAAEELKRVLHRQRGMVASWGMAGVAAGMLAAERAEDVVAAWREAGPRLAEVLPEVFAVIEARHGGLRAG